MFDLDPLRHAHRVLGDSSRFGWLRPNGHSHDKKQTFWRGEKITKSVRTVRRLPAVFATRNTFVAARKAFVSLYGFLGRESPPGRLNENSARHDPFDRVGCGGGFRICFCVHSLRHGEDWSTVQTDPLMDVRSTRWIGKTVEVLTPDWLPWEVGSMVMLTLKPYG
jgi:hypothetical protein